MEGGYNIVLTNPVLILSGFRSFIIKLLVFVHLGGYHKMPQMGWLINDRNLFLTVQEAGGPRLACQHGWVRALFWSWTSSYVLLWQKGLRISLEPLL